MGYRPYDFGRSETAQGSGVPSFVLELGELARPVARGIRAQDAATRAASAVTWRHPADMKYGRGEPKRSLATLTEPSATTVRDREAPRFEKTLTGVLTMRTGL
jgi:hypothetical protein